MAIFRINKNKDYTTMCNFHLKDTQLSLKAKGLLSVMLSLPENWDYSVRGLTEICKETKDTINSVLKELEDNKYLIRKRIYCNGKISDWEYNIYESKNLYPKNQDIENQDIENQDINNITKEINTKEYKENNIIINNNIIKEKFKKPSIEEIQEYCLERSNNINAEAFYDFYESKNWYIGKNKMKDWKAAVRTWEKNNKKTFVNSKQRVVPEWFNQEIDSTNAKIEDQEWNDFLEEFRR